MAKGKQSLLLGSTLIALTIFLVGTSYYSGTRYVGDTALYAQITNNIAYTGKAEGNIFANTQDYIDRQIAVMPVEERISDPDAFKPPEKQTRNILTFHSCIILYLLAPLCYFMSAFSCVTLAQSVALVFSIYFLILLMREKDIPIVVIFTTVLLLISHPGWSMPAVYGAFYPERLFMGTGMYLIWAIDKQRFNKVHFVLATILCILVGERGALYAGMFILAYTIFYWKEKPEYRKLKFAIGSISLIYAGILMKFVLVNLYYSNISEMINIFPYLSNPENRKKVILFLIINVSLFLILALFDFRAFIIGAASMVPNLLYDTGGAEKIGWTLHYHVFYFVILMWAVTKGIIKLYTILRNKEIKIQRIVPTVTAIIFAFLIGLIEPMDISISFNIKNLKNNILYNGIKEISTDYIAGGYRVRKKFNEFVKENVAENTAVSTIESGMCSVADRNQIFLFPMGTDLADAAIVEYTEEEGEIYYKGAVSYTSKEEEKKLNQFVVEKMTKEGYDFQNPNLFRPYGIAIIKKK